MEIQGLHDHLRGTGISQAFYIRHPEASPGHGPSNTTSDVEPLEQLARRFARARLPSDFGGACSRSRAGPLLI